MKNYYLLLFMISMSTAETYSQPQLNASNFPSNYSALAYNGNVAGLSAGNAGANQVWNYGSVPTTYNFEIIKIPVESTPFAISFPAANYCWKYVHQDYNEFLFFNVNNSSFEVLGLANDFKVTSQYGPDTPTIFTFPYTYNTVLDDTFQFAGDPAIYNGTSTQYDAYGTIITPFGTYNNAIRQRDGNQYIWFNVNPFYLIASGNFVNYLYFYETNPLSTVQSIADNQIAVYPNPTNEILNLKLPNNTTIDKLIINDLTGKIVKEQSQNTNAVNVENLASGMYLLKVFSGESTFETKFVKQ